MRPRSLRDCSYLFPFLSPFGKIFPWISLLDCPYRMGFLPFSSWLIGSLKALISEPNNTHTQLTKWLYSSWISFVSSTTSLEASFLTVTWYLSVISGENYFVSTELSWEWAPRITQKLTARPRYSIVSFNSIFRPLSTINPPSGTLFFL